MIESPLLHNNHPFVHGRIKAIWGSIECRRYLCDLVVENNDGPALDHEFTFGEVREVMDLITEHDKDFPMYTPTPSVW